MPYGAPFLEEEGVVEDIIWIAEQSEVLTLKGTAFFVLGLISRTWIGVEILGSYGWEAGVEGVTGEPKGLVMPKRVAGLLHVSSFLLETRREASDYEMLMEFLNRSCRGSTRGTRRTTRADHHYSPQSAMKTVSTPRSLGPSPT